MVVEIDKNGLQEQVITRGRRRRVESSQSDQEMVSDTSLKKRKPSLIRRKKGRVSSSQSSARYSQDEEEIEDEESISEKSSDYGKKRKIITRSRGRPVSAKPIGRGRKSMKNKIEEIQEVAEELVDSDEQGEFCFYDGVGGFIEKGS